MEEIRGDSGEDLERGGETGSRTGICVMKFGSRRRITGKPKGFAKRALSGKSIVALTWPLLLNTKETRLGAVARIAFMGSTSTRKEVASSVMSTPILCADDDGRRTRTTASQVAQTMALGTLEQDRAVLKDRGTSNFTKQGGGITKDKIEL